MDTSEVEVGMRHSRSIIHLDVDCFYAQVEMIRHPEHKGKPLGVRQKNIVVTSNYLAREFGITKCMQVDEALRLCPSLILIRGEDLTNYRRTSRKISEILLAYTPLVERSGLDESFVDVSALVDDYSRNSRDKEIERLVPGEIYGETVVSSEEECPCDCHSRLRSAARIAADIRKRIFQELELTCSAGIGHNKLVAKLAGSMNKPDQQTLVYPWAASSILTAVGSIGKIPGVGPKTLKLLADNDLNNVDDIRRMSLEDLEARIGGELSKKLKDNAEGIDETAVKPSGKPQSIGLEDGFSSNVSVSLGEVESRLAALLRRLAELATEDGRIPVALRITIRKTDSKKSGGSSKRETRQCALPRHLLPTGDSGIYDHAKMLHLALKLFHRAVDVTRPFHLTLLGVAFTKFEERTSGRSSITSFLRKQVAVQSVLDIGSEGTSDTSLGSPMSVNQDSNDAIEGSNTEGTYTEPLPVVSTIYSGHKTIQANSKEETDVETTSFVPLNPGYDAEDYPTGDHEPLPKKTKLEVWLSGRRETPSNEMAGLKLGPSSPASSTLPVTLPIDLQRQVDTHRSWQPGKTKPNNILKYFIANK